MQAQRPVQLKTPVVVAVLLAVLGFGFVLLLNMGADGTESGVGPGTKASPSFDASGFTTNDSGHAVIKEKIHTETDDDLDRTWLVNNAFRSVSQNVLTRIQPSIDEKFFDEGAPHSYERHRVVEIDTAALRDQLKNSLLNDTHSRSTEMLSIPLFADYVVRIKVTDWIDSGMGVESAYGHVDTGRFAPDSLQLHISDTGRLEASLIADDDGFVISQITDDQYYIVMQLRSYRVID